MITEIKKYLYDLLHPCMGEVWQLHRVTHTVSVDIRDRKYEITPERLEQLILAYLNNDYHFVSVELIKRMVEKQRYPFKFVAVTLDDGYADNYEEAYPIFKKYNIPFCIFLTRDFILHGHKDYRMLSSDAISNLCSDPLCTFGSHTVSHPHLAQLPTDEQAKQIADCNQWLEPLIDRSVSVMAYPYGSYNASTLKVMPPTISLAFSAWGGAIRKGKRYSLLQVPRVLITQEQPLIDIPVR